MLQRLLLAAAWLLFGAIRLYASHITLQISTTPQFRDNQLQCTLNITNQGDEPAANVQAHLEFQGRRHSSQNQPTLAVGQSTAPNFNFPVTGLSGGRYPLVVIVDYTDTNGYPFTALSSADFIVGEDNPAKIHGVIDAVELGKQARLEMRLKNLDATPRELKLRLVLPKELSSSQYENQIALGGSGEQTVRFPLVNFSALEGSTYQIFVLSEYDEQGKHSSLFTPGTVKIVPARSFYRQYQIPILVGAGVLLVLFIGIQFYTRRSS